MSLNALPVSLEPWQVSLVEAAMTVGEDKVPGLILVVCERSQEVRALEPAMPGVTLESVVRQAALRPMQGAPSRPSVLEVATRRDRKALAKLARKSGGKVVQVASLPAVEAMRPSLVAYFGAPDLLPPQPDLWRPVLDMLWKEQPWQSLPEQIVFRFDAPPQLRGGVAIVIGGLGEELGLNYFPTARDHERFLTFAGSPRGLPHDVTVFSLTFGEADDRARAANMVFGGGRAPHLMKIADGSVGPLETSGEEQRLLAVSQAVVSAWLEWGEVLLDGAKTELGTLLGDVVVTTDGMADEGEQAFIWEADHVVMSATQGELPEIILKLAKRDAEQLAVRCAHVESVRFEQTDHGATIVALDADGSAIGVLSRGRVLPEALLMKLQAAQRMTLRFLSGGAKRRSLAGARIIFEREVGAEVSGLDPAPPTADHGWPKGSDTLLEFVRPYLPYGEPLEAYKNLYTVGATVFSAVSAADHGGSSAMLDEVRVQQRKPGGELIGMLVERKRALFRSDPRIIYVDRVWYEAGEVRLNVQWSVVGG